MQNIKCWKCTTFNLMASVESVGPYEVIETFISYLKYPSNSVIVENVGMIRTKLLTCFSVVMSLFGR
jgi:hypothetical protein